MLEFLLLFFFAGALVVLGLGLLEAAVTCFGANGGDSVEGLKSKIGRSKCSTLYICASSLPLSKGTHVP